MLQIREEMSFTRSRIIVRGKLVTRPRGSVLREALAPGMATMTEAAE